MVLQDAKMMTVSSCVSPEYAFFCGLVFHDITATLFAFAKQF